MILQANTLSIQFIQHQGYSTGQMQTPDMVQSGWGWQGGGGGQLV